MAEYRYPQSGLSQFVKCNKKKSASHMADLILLYCQTVKYCADMSYLFRASLLKTSNIIKGGLFHLSNSKKKEKKGRQQLQNWRRPTDLALLLTSTNTGIAFASVRHVHYISLQPFTEPSPSGEFKSQ